MYLRYDFALDDQNVPSGLLHSIRPSKNKPDSRIWNISTYEHQPSSFVHAWNRNRLTSRIERMDHCQAGRIPADFLLHTEGQLTRWDSPSKKHPKCHLHLYFGWLSPGSLPQWQNNQILNSELPHVIPSFVHMNWIWIWIVSPRI